MILQARQICQFSNSCKYHNKNGSFCQGTNPERNHIFECSFVNDMGEDIKEGRNRNINDITGKMEFIQD